MANSGTEIQLNPPLPPPTVIQGQPQPLDSYAHYNLYNYGDPNYSFYYSQPQPQPQPQNPNPFPDHHHFTHSIGAAQIQPVPAGYDPGPPVPANPHANSYVSPSGFEAPQLGFTYPSYQTLATPADYHAPNQNVVFQSVGVNLYGAGVTVPSTGMQNLASAATTQIIASQRSSSSKKGPKKIKIVQSVWCEVCRVDCNSKNVLDQHRLGKKHKKNLEKLITANTSVLVPSSVPPTSTVAANTFIGPQENAVSAASSQIEAGADDLETKRKKVLKEGAAANSVRMCAVCNVVCNSETVFRYHLAGQKHASKLRKQANAATILAAAQT